jgi:CheY-like chemotaxis protein
MDSTPLRILLVDDNKHGLRARKTLLEESGYSIVTASSGKSGLTKFAQGEFDLVVTDYCMPGVQGSEVIAKVHELNAKTPIIVLSGHVARLGLTKDDVGADLVVAKGPNEARDLTRAVQRLTRGPAKKKPVSEKGQTQKARRHGAGS